MHNKPKAAYVCVQFVIYICIFLAPAFHLKINFTPIISFSIEFTISLI